MKKFLLILLIAIASSATIEFDGTYLQDWWSDLWEKVQNFIRNIPGYLKACYDYLVSIGAWEQIVEIVKKYGKPKAIELCTNYFGKKDLCTDIINLLFTFIK